MWPRHQLCCFINRCIRCVSCDGLPLKYASFHIFGLSFNDKFFHFQNAHPYPTRLQFPSVQMLNYKLRIIKMISPTVFPRQAEVKHIVERCMLIRAILREKLRLLGTPGCWNHLTQQGGLFCCTGLNGENQRALFKAAPFKSYVSNNLDGQNDSLHQPLTRTT